MKPLPSPLRSSINKLAHLMADEYEREQKRAISAHLLRMRASGASQQDLLDELMKMRREVLLPGWPAPASGGADPMPVAGQRQRARRSGAASIG